MTTDPTKLTSTFQTLIEPTLGEKLSFTANATTDSWTPIISYNWSLIANDGSQQLLVSDSTYTLSNDSRTLKFNVTSSKTNGRYRVVATNGISSDYAEIVVRLPVGLYYSVKYFSFR